MMIILNENDYSQFRDWVCLNLDAVTWQGRFKQDFEDFWEHFFIPEMTLSDLVDRFESAKNLLKIGPLVSWFDWLKNKFIVYIFIFKGVSIGELATGSGIAPGQIGHVLRSFFIEYFPRFDDELSDFFQLSNVASDNFNIRISDIKRTLPINLNINGSHDDEIMPSMEVTLYEEWSVFLQKLKKEKTRPQMNSKTIKEKASLANQYRFVKDVVFLFIIASACILIVQKLNVFYENYLIEKISIYEPQFQWLDRTLVFKDIETNTAAGDFNLDVEDLDEVVDVAGNFGIIEDEERFDPESEVTLTSWDALPRDFNVAGLEVSSFEELTSGGYRDSRFGNTKVYRVMMKSVDTNEVRGQLDTLLMRYGVVQADNVKPGLNVPGGVYYNLFVPLENLKEFIAQVMEVDDSILYESRTRAGRNPVGMNKVFIWVKSI